MKETEQMNNPFEIIKQDLEQIKSMLQGIEKPQKNSQSNNQDNSFLAQYVPKSEVRGKLASASTLWKYEKQGKLQAFAIGGKRFYKKADLENALVKLNKKVDAI